MYNQVHDTLECPLFKWDSWDELDTGVFCFYEVTLVVDMRQFKKGDVFDSAVFDMGESQVVLQQVIGEGKFRQLKEYVFKLKLTAEYVEERIA